MVLVFIGHWPHVLLFMFFFFNDTATTEIYTLSLHDALPIFGGDLNFELIEKLPRGTPFAEFSKL